MIETITQESLAVVSSDNHAGALTADDQPYVVAHTQAFDDFFKVSDLNLVTTTKTNAQGANVSEAVNRAASHLYDAECALHASHQTGVDAWIAAASDRLHEAVVEFVAAQDALAAAPLTHGRLQLA
jgi:hypothetical protein